MGHEFKASLNLISEIPGPNDSHVWKETAFETVKQTMRQMLEPWKIKARAERAGLLSFKRVWDLLFSLGPECSPRGSQILQ